ncbi:MAG: PD40 domain-containing protein, partial [Bacteroidia bacterium]|nr:PD40 domain-containing protein [Bacteroidia bacterium]
MYKTFTSILFCLSIALTAQEDKKNNLITTTGDVAKLIVAKQKLYAGNYNGALSIYHEVEKNDPKNASIKYYIGLCYFNMAQNQNAKESLNKAIELRDGVEPATYFVLGQIFHNEGDIDKALEHFTTFTNSKGGSSETQQQAAVYMEQCNTAKRLMASPWKVNISNLGNEVNSRFDDKNPCITADGKKLVFTTRRPESAKDMVDFEGDGKFFENVYLSQLDSAKQLFISVSPLDKHINSPAHDACTSISPDGKQLFIYRNDINNKESRGGNVFVSKQLSGKWKNPENLGKPINTTANWEGGVCVSPDGKRYFFTSERKGGFGGSDIWMVERKSKKVWGEPINLG